MKILEHIAQDIVEKTRNILDYPISITNKEGYIVGSTDRSRLGNFHKPSLDVIKNNQAFFYEENDLKNNGMDYILPGIAVPLELNRTPIGVLGIIGNPSDITNYVQLIKNQVEMLCLEAFRKETTYLERRMNEMFIQQLIYQTGEEDEHSINQFAEQMGYSLNQPSVCLLIELTDLDADPRKRNDNGSAGSLTPSYSAPEWLHYLKLIRLQTEQDILSQLSLQRYLLIKLDGSPSNDNDWSATLAEQVNKLNHYLKNKYNLKVVVSVGSMQTGTKGIAESYRNAVKAMSAGKHSQTTDPIFHYYDFRTILAMLPFELSTDMNDQLKNLIKPLIEQSNFDVLRNTFLAYCDEQMNVSQTARQLFVHRNTVIYRLEKIRELTGLQIEQFQHCLLLYLALKSS